MIGKSLNERYNLNALSSARAVDILKGALGTQAKPIIEVRAQDARMVACLIVDADERAVRLVRSIGLELKPGATAVFGLFGDDLTSLCPQLSEHQRRWLAEPCRPRETKVFLVAEGLALLSIESSGGEVTLTAIPAQPDA